MKRLTLILLLSLTLVIPAELLFGQTTVIDYTTLLAMDPNVRIGTLDNGLVYYIRQNKKPEKRVELRLVVNAGSILENNSQLGLAHFTEHMCFNGTRSFPKNELINFLQKTGVQFGADINAYTGFDETVYMLKLPTDEEGLVEKGFQVLEEWAHEVTFDGKEIDKERGVIVEEWRLGLGAQDRMMKKFLPVILKGSQYAERIPIGKVEILESFKHDTLRAFYYTWYRPDLQAVVVVGDINPDSAEQQIKTHFSGLTNPTTERERVVFDLPGNREPLIAITTDKEAMQNVILMFWKHPKKQVQNLGDFKEHIAGELFTGMLNQRFTELSQQPDCPFVFANAGYGDFLARTRDSYLMTTMPKENQTGQTLAVVLAENERVRRYGFTSTEFTRQKEEMLSRYEQAAKEFDKTESENFARAYVDNYLNHSPIPGAQKEFKYLTKLLPEITLEEVNQLAQKWVTDDNLAMVIMGPEKEGLNILTESEVLEIIRSSKTQELQAYIDNFREEPLVTADLSGGAVAEMKTLSELGYTELTLSNGLRVILKPTTFKNDEILVSAYSPGGSSLVEDDQFLSASFASSIIDQSGAGEFDNVELQKKLKGENLSISPYIDDVKEGFRGNSTPKDLQTLMELVYLYFEGPRKDTSAFQAFISQMENQMKFMKSNPIMAFYDTLFKTAFPGNKRLIIFPTQQQLESIVLDTVFRIYCNRFADASDFTFLLVGNFTVDSITPLVTKYLGNLPSLKRVETWRDKAPRFASGSTNTFFYKGADPQSMVGITMSEPFSWNENNVLYLIMLKEILSIKLVEVIREKLSGVYSPQIMLNFDQYPRSEFMMAILFGCSPKTTEKLSKAVFGELHKFRKHGPTEVDLNKAKELLLRNRETDLEKNEFWLSKIESLYFNGGDPAFVLNYKERVNAVTVEDLKTAANAFFKPDHYVRVVLMPEKK
ncbi:MAG: insulinase family protein [bacterium]